MNKNEIDFDFNDNEILQIMNENIENNEKSKVFFVLSNDELININNLSLVGWGIKVYCFSKTTGFEINDQKFIGVISKIIEVIKKP